MDASTEDILDRVRRRKQECAKLFLDSTSVATESTANERNDENQPGVGGQPPAVTNAATEPQQKSPLKSALRSPRKEAAEIPGSSATSTTRSKTTTFSAQLECMSTPGGGDEERRTLRRSKFAELSAQMEEFECELKREKAKQGSAVPQGKEHLLRGPQKRISMGGGETRASVLFAPQDPVYKSPEKRPPERASSVEKSPMCKHPTPTATTPKKEEGQWRSSLHHSLCVGGQRRRESPLAVGSGSKKASSIHLLGTGSPKPYTGIAASTTSRRTEFAVMNQEGVEYIDDDVVEESEKAGKEKSGENVETADLDSSSEYGIHTFGQPVERKERPGEMVTEQAPSTDLPPTPKRRLAPQPDTASAKTPICHPQKVVAVGESCPASTVRTPVTPSVKALRNRWEVSSATGTPLHPDSSNEELLNTALGMAATAVGAGRQAVKRNFQLTKKPTYQQIMDELGDSGGSTRVAMGERKTINSPAPKSARFNEGEVLEPSGAVMEEADLTASEDGGAPCRERTPSPAPSAAWSMVGDFKTPVHDGSEAPPHRPVTPNHELLGSLMEEIDRDLRSQAQLSQPEKEPASPDRPGADNGGGLHTISNYRLLGSAKRQQQAHRTSEDPFFMGTSPVKALNFDSVDSSPALLHASSTAVPSNDATLKRLHEAIVVQQDQICQASRALAFCRQNELFRGRGSREEVDAQRALLIATERRRAYWSERERIMAASGGSAGGGDVGVPRGTLTFSYIAVRLSRDFVNAYCQQGPQESQLYYLIVLIKHGETVLHTTLASSDEGLKNGFVEFSHYIQLAGLLPNFQCSVEVYALRAIRPSSEQQGKKRGGTWKRIIGATPIGGCGSVSGTSILGPSGGPIGVVDPGFQKVGSLRLNRSQVGVKNKFLLSDTLYPLDGQLMLQMRCFAEPATDSSADQRGFLSLYQVVSGLGAWTRFWALLHDGQMRFWQYPEDEEKGKGPTVFLSLNKCLTKVSEVTTSVASFPHSMQVDVAIGEGDAPKEEIRMLFAADTREDMEKWMRAINEAIRNCHTWSTA